jgi:hypothetical protein
MKTITVNTIKEDDYPIITSKESEATDNGYLMVDVMVAEEKEYRGRVVNMSTNGIYIIELLEEV